MKFKQYQAIAKKFGITLKRVGKSWEMTGGGSAVSREEDHKIFWAEMLLRHALTHKGDVADYIDGWHEAISELQFKTEGKTFDARLWVIENVLPLLKE